VQGARLALPLLQRHALLWCQIADAPCVSCCVLVLRAFVRCILVYLGMYLDRRALGLTARHHVCL
jgi:hypothetical protein